MLFRSSADGRRLLLAPRVPAFGYKVFHTRRTASTETSSALDVGATSLSNQFYKIEFDSQTGVIRSIYDKELKRELVDPAARHGFNQLVYVHKMSREAKEGDDYSPIRATLRPGRAGSVSASFTVEINDVKTGAAITQRITLYDKVKRIDIVNDLRHVRALHSNSYEDRYRDNIYFAFPIKVE